MKVKPKKRTMAEILASAPRSTIEDLDKRNGTNWAVDLASIRVSGEIPGCADSSETNKLGALSETKGDPTEKFSWSKKVERHIEERRRRSVRRTVRRKKIQRENATEKVSYSTLSLSLSLSINIYLFLFSTEIVLLNLYAR